jgi:hypothetical protein
MQLVHPKSWVLEMPFVTFTVRRGLSTTDKSRLSEAMTEAQAAAGYHRADSFHRFLAVDHDDLLVDPRFPDYATDRTDRFMVVEVVISSGRPTGTAVTIADEAVRLFSRLRTSYSSSTRWNRTSRAFLLRRSVLRFGNSDSCNPATMICRDGLFWNDTTGHRCGSPNTTGDRSNERHGWNRA